MPSLLPQPAANRPNKVFGPLRSLCLANARKPRSGLLRPINNLFDKNPHHAPRTRSPLGDAFKTDSRRDRFTLESVRRSRDRQSSHDDPDSQERESGPPAKKMKLEHAYNSRLNGLPYQSAPTVINISDEESLDLDRQSATLSLSTRRLGQKVLRKSAGYGGLVSAPSEARTLDALINSRPNLQQQAQGTPNQSAHSPSLAGDGSEDHSTLKPVAGTVSKKRPQRRMEDELDILPDSKGRSVREIDGPALKRSKHDIEEDDDLEIVEPHTLKSKHAGTPQNQRKQRQSQNFTARKSPMKQTTKLSEMSVGASDSSADELAESAPQPFRNGPDADHKRIEIPETPSPPTNKPSITGIPPATIARKASAKVASKKGRRSLHEESYPHDFDAKRLEFGKGTFGEEYNIVLKWEPDTRVFKAWVDRALAGTIDIMMIQTVSHAGTDESCNLVRLKGPTSTTGPWHFDIDFVDYETRHGFVSLLENLKLLKVRFPVETA